MKEKGQSLVELGITFLFLMLLLGGAVEFGTLFFQYVQLRDAAQEGALYASVYPYDTVSIEQRVRSASQSPIELSDPAVQVFISYPDNSLCEGFAVTVSVAYEHQIFMPFLPQILREDYILLVGEVTNTILNQDCNV